MATGVLILGVGSGTKSLGSFLECTKSYEAVIIFGAATDTYDAVGKIVAKKSYDHVTKGMVKEALEKFRGKIMQRPPIFSALKVQGKPLYQYAREGKEVPIEIEERPVEVHSLEMVEWMDGGTHSYNWPDEEAPEEEKVVVDKVLHLDADVGSKRKREYDGVIEFEDLPSSKRTKSSPTPEPAKLMKADESVTPEGPSLWHNSPCPAPACRLRMTVTSGFYVRSLAHDLGAAVNSLSLMSSLIRTRQGDFELGKNVLEYNDLAKGEDEWAPKVGSMLAEWKEKDEGEGRDVEIVTDAPRSKDARLLSGKERKLKKDYGVEEEREEG
jgi:tRNA pseudouridine55 synthase